MIARSRRRFLGQAAAFLALACSGPAAAGSREILPRRPFRRGVNVWPWFSLTREYPAPSREYGWPPFQIGRPVPTAADLRRLRASGLDFIRLPVDPGPFLAMTPEQVAPITDMLMHAVGTAIEAGLRVVVNVQANAATHYWTPQNLFSSTAAPAFEAYRAFIGALAGRLAQFDARMVALEPVNEPPQACGAPAWSEVQAALLTAARTAAPDLLLIATGSCGSMVSGLAALDPAPLRAFEPIMFTFHFYEPYLFTHQGAPWMSEPVYRALNAVPWPASAGSLNDTLAAVRARMAQDGELSPAAKQAAYRTTEEVLKVYFDAQPDRGFIDGYLSRVIDWGRAHDIAPERILMGEFGALRTDERYVAAPAADRARYIADVRLSAEERGLPWAFWNLFDGMGMMDDTTRLFDPAVIEALGLVPPPD